MPAVCSSHTHRLPGAALGAEVGAHRGSACPWEASVFGAGVREQTRSSGGDSSLEKIMAEKGARALRGGEGLLFYRKACKHSSWDKVALGQRPPHKEPAHPGEECLDKGPAA